MRSHLILQGERVKICGYCQENIKVLRLFKDSMCCERFGDLTRMIPKVDLIFFKFNLTEKLTENQVRPNREDNYEPILQTYVGILAMSLLLFSTVALVVPLNIEV